MTAIIDTNVLVYAADVATPEHERCKAVLQSCAQAATPWYLTWGIVYEFMRVVTHPGMHRTPMNASNAWTHMLQLMASPNLRMLAETTRHAEVAAEVFRMVPEIRGTIVFDARTAILMKEHGITRIITRDTDFFRFPFLEVIDPLQAPPGLVKEGRVSYGRPRRRTAAARA